MKSAIAAISLLASLFIVSADVLAQQNADQQKAVLITGASTGIGRNMAETLAKEGYFIYAGARKQADIEALSAIDNIQGIRLDVTVQEEIDAAVAHVRSEGRGLYGLVNNAGVATLGALIEADEADLEFLMDVNVFGPYRVTKAFAPLIIESKGRITTTGSISGILSRPLLGYYAMSKHAMEAFADTLAVEMERFGVAVSVIEPGNYKSSISASVQARAAQSSSSASESLYAEELSARSGGPVDRSQYKDPDEVSEALSHFLSSDRPNRRYMVVPNKGEAELTTRKFIEELAQLNQWHAYSYDRDELVEMLDEALARQEGSE